MSLLVKVNILRRRLTKFLTKKIGRSNIRHSQQLNYIDKNKVKRVLISRPNHRLGNMLLITPIVQEVSNVFPNCKIDIFVKGNVANSVFENYDNIDKIIILPKEHFKYIFKYLLSWSNLRSERYDIAINCIESSSSGKISTLFARAKYKYFGDESINNEFEISDIEWKHYAKNTIYGFREFLLSRRVMIDTSLMPKMDIKLSKNEISEGKKVINKLTKNKKETISLFTYATGDKCYTEEWWNDFYDLLKQNFPNHNFIEILPLERISKIGFKAPSYYSKDLRQIASVIANTKLFIGADSGMMHLASASLTTTIGLFSVSEANSYKPYGNNSFAINTNDLNKLETLQLLKKIIT